MSYQAGYNASLKTAGITRVLSNVLRSRPRPRVAREHLEALMRRMDQMGIHPAIVEGAQKAERAVRMRGLPEERLGPKALANILPALLSDRAARAWKGPLDFDAPMSEISKEIVDPEFSRPALNTLNRAIGMGEDVLDVRFPTLEVENILYEGVPEEAVRQFKEDIRPAVPVVQRYLRRPETGLRIPEADEVVDFTRELGQEAWGKTLPEREGNLIREMYSRVRPLFTTPNIKEGSARSFISRHAGNVWDLPSNVRSAYRAFDVPPEAMQNIPLAAEQEFALEALRQSLGSTGLAALLAGGVGGGAYLATREEPTVMDRLRDALE